MNTLKQILNTLDVTLEALRSGERGRKLSDARALIAAALPLSQEQVAELLNCSRQAVGKMRRRHEGLLRSDANYRAQWEQILSLESLKSLKS